MSDEQLETLKQAQREEASYHGKELEKWQHRTDAGIPVFITGGIGDNVLAVPVIRELQKHGTIELYSHYPDAYNYFRDVDATPARRDFFPVTVADWWIEVNLIVRPMFSRIFKGFDYGERRKEQGLCEMLTDHAHAEFSFLVNNHAFYDGRIAERAVRVGLNRRTLPLAMLGVRPYVGVENWPRTTLLQDYITIHDGFDIQQKGFIKERSTKNWSRQQWEFLVAQIKASRQDLRIIQLGSTVSQKIEGVDECLLNQTNIGEAFDIISGSSLHIDGDSGLVHAAAALGVKSVVMWGPTNKEFFSYPQNVNLTGPGCAGGCWWLKKDWMKSCVLGYETPKCMDSISVDTVLNAVLENL